MKKTVTLPDGTTEVLEGTPEEIAAHEKLIREQGKSAPSKSKKDVLKGTGILDSEQLERLIEALKKTEPSSPPWWMHLNPIWEVTCSQCGQYNCICKHIDLTPRITYGIMTSNSIKLSS